MSFNTITIVGNLGRDPELRYTSSGTAVCQFSVASNDRIKKGGDWEKHTTWFRVTCFGRQAENVHQYLQKGRQVFVQGTLRIEEWMSRENEKRWTAEVRADKVQFLGKADDSEARERSERTDRDDDRSPDQSNEIVDEDIPF